VTGTQPAETLSTKQQATHFPMSDLNNVQVADLVSTFLAQKGLE